MSHVCVEIVFTFVWNKFSLEIILSDKTDMPFTIFPKAPEVVCSVGCVMKMKNHFKIMATPKFGVYIYNLQEKGVFKHF